MREYKSSVRQRHLAKLRYEKNKERLLALRKERYYADPEKHVQSTIKWQKKNPERHLANQASVRATPKHKQYLREYDKKRRATDVLYRLKKRLRSRCREAFKVKKFYKPSGLRVLLGCEAEEVQAYIQNQFTVGMSWDNWGEWHLDHRVPLAIASTPEELVRLCHYSNLQPLWAVDNQKKSDSYESTSARNLRKNCPECGLVIDRDLNASINLNNYEKAARPNRASRVKTDRVGLRKTKSVAGPLEPVNINLSSMEGRCQPHS